MKSRADSSLLPSQVPRHLEQHKCIVFPVRGQKPDSGCMGPEWRFWSLGGSERGSISLTVPASRGHPHSSAQGPSCTFKVSGWQLQISSNSEHLHVSFSPSASSAAPPLLSDSLPSRLERPRDDLGPPRSPRTLSLSQVLQLQSPLAT